VKTSREFRMLMAERLALPMFCLSTLFLALLGVLIVLYVDVPRLVEPPAGSPENASAPVAEGPPQEIADKEVAALSTGRLACVRAAVLIWPIFWIEFLLQYLWRDREVPFWKTRYFGLVICLCPPLRISARNGDMDGKIWLPVTGWVEVDDQLRERLEKTFSIPMIFIALLILPVLLVELTMTEQVAQNRWLRNLLHFGTGLIWFAFALEFILMVSVAKKKLRYCREHWLDLAIILLPLISFLRSLRAVRAMRVARLAKVQQLGKMSRLYRLRGLAMRAFRALMLLELVNRLLGVSLEKRLRKLREQLEEKEQEIESLRRVIIKLEKELEACEEANEVCSKPEPSNDAELNSEPAP
jgi:voltage-gated potassium channel